jgi:putative ABC transport system permease protein
MNKFAYDMITDLRYALRQLIKSPGFTLIAVLTLALGIGANTAIFSVVNTVLLQPLPYKETNHLLALSLVFEQGGPEGSPLSPADVFDFQAQNRNRDFDFAGFSDNVFSYTGGSNPEQIAGAWTTADFFSTLGVAPLLGRGFLPNEDRAGGRSVVVLSENFWRSHFNADPQVLGRSINLNGLTRTIVGVMPASFQFPDRTMQLWVALPLETPTTRGPYFLRGLLRFPNEVSLEQARAELAAMASAIRRAHPELPPNYGYITTPLNDWLVGKVRPALLVLLGAVGLVLLIAALNVANLLLSRAATREREISIRAALGASRGRIMRQFLTENLLLAAAGGSAGLLLSVWGIDLLRTLGPDNVPRLQDVTVDRWVLGWTALISLGSGLFFGLAPAWQGSRLNLNAALKEGGRSGGEASGARRLRSGLVVCEVALAMMLLIAAGLLIRSFLRLEKVHPGFAKEQILTMQVPLPRAKYPEPALVVGFYDRLLQKVQTLPGVQAAALTSSLPPNGLEVSDTFLAEGQPAVDDAHAPLGSFLLTTPGYFSTLGVALQQGRDFNEHDTANSTPVVIINQTLARKYFPGQNPLGKRLKEGGTDRKGTSWMQVIGVVGDVKYEGLERPTAPAYYLPFQQNPMRDMFLVLHTGMKPSAIAASVRAAVRAIDPEIPVARVNTMRELVESSIAQPRFRTFLLGVFSALAMVLAAIGIYGVVAYSVAQRTREISIRMALGAQRRDVLTLVVRQGLILTLLGIGAGLVGAFLLTRLMESLLFGVVPSDPATFLGISLLLLAIAFLACYLPARRATKVDPMVALRYE